MESVPVCPFGVSVLCCDSVDRDDGFGVSVLFCDGVDRDDGYRRELVGYGDDGVFDLLFRFDALVIVAIVGCWPGEVRFAGFVFYG